MADDSSDNAFSFAGHAAAPAAGTQPNSSQSIDTDSSELTTQLPRRALAAPRGRLPSIPAIEDAGSVSGKRRTSDRQSSPPTTPRKRLLLHHHQVILPKGTRKPRRKTKLHLFFQLHRQKHTRTRRTRKAGRRVDHHHLLTRRRSSATTSSIKVGAVRVTSASTVIPRKSMMQE